MPPILTLRVTDRAATSLSVRNAVAVEKALHVIVEHERRRGDVASCARLVGFNAVAETGAGDADEEVGVR